MQNISELKIYQLLARQEHIRIEAFGASNTQRYMPGMHWFDYVELGFKNTFGGDCGQFINAGCSGNTTFDLLNRFDADVANYRPHLVILTIGGNDCNPANRISPTEFRENLKTIQHKISKLDGEVVFQTYYACELEKIEPPEYGAKMGEYMQIVRETAAELGCLLHDNDVRWAALRDTDIASYRLLMRNAMHVNSIGNMVIGLDLMRFFGLNLLDEYRGEFIPGLLGQALLDQVKE